MTNYPIEYKGNLVTPEGRITRARIIKTSWGWELWGTVDGSSEIHLDTVYSYEGEKTTEKWMR